MSVGAAIAGGLGAIGGGLIDTGVNTWQKYEDRKFNAEQAQIQRDFEKEMSNTQYQRAMADMQAAGLNPAMMFNSGANGASTPSGASASSSGANVANSNIAGTINAIANVMQESKTRSIDDKLANTAIKITNQYIKN